MDRIVCPLDGQTYDDRNDYDRALDRASARDGQKYHILGNDCVGQWQKVRERKPQDFTYEQMRDAKEYALSVRSDPAKLRAWHNENEQIRTEHERAGIKYD